jgi:hypothetical protein
MTYTTAQLEAAQTELERCKVAQTELWDASLRLEKILGFDIDTCDDLQDVDLDELIAIKS